MNGSRLCIDLRHVYIAVTALSCFQLWSSRHSNREPADTDSYYKSQLYNRIQVILWNWFNYIFNRIYFHDVIITQTGWNKQPLVIKSDESSKNGFRGDNFKCWSLIYHPLQREISIHFYKLFLISAIKKTSDTELY